MSDNPFDKALKKADKYFDRSNWPFEMEIALIKGLRMNLSFENLLQSRFEEYEKFVSEGNTVMTHEELNTYFLNKESTLSLKIYFDYEKKDLPDTKTLRARAMKYLYALRNFTIKPKGHSYFFWTGNNPQLSKKEVRTLIKGLLGNNSLNIVFVDAENNEKILEEFFLYGQIEHFIVWKEDDTLLLLLLDYLFADYLQFQNLTLKNSDKVGKPNLIWEEIYQLIVKVFRKKNGDKYETKNLTSLKSKMKDYKSKKRACIDEIKVQIENLTYNPTN